MISIIMLKKRQMQVKICFLVNQWGLLLKRHQHHHNNNPHCSNVPATIHITEQVVSESPISPAAAPPSSILEPQAEPLALPVLQEPDADHAEVPDADQEEPTIYSEEAPAEELPHQEHPILAVCTGKSDRTSKPSIWLKDYVTIVKSTKDTPYTISNFITYDHLSENYKFFLGSFSEPIEPKSFKEACQKIM
ncbi:hypothetical protein A4A49_25961 [Nicotiana attenuata]|uniref:Uncharacterized protein n=1 Tax=Nicotiana attenuata TaxID=49451 RepID=A0A314LGD5_NICAT|nr:hypothetical protein A4A49_25961 [Nicotiana attenuata]